MPAGFSCTDGPRGPGISPAPATVERLEHRYEHSGRAHVHGHRDQRRRSVEHRSVTYTVQPDNHEVTKFKALANGTFIVIVKVPGPGRVDVLVTAWNNNLATTATLLNPAPHRFVFARAHGIANRARTLKITVKPTARGRKLVASHTYQVTLRVWISYTPRGGRQRNIGYYNVHLP